MGAVSKFVALKSTKTRDVIHSHGRIAYYKKKTTDNK